MKIKCRIKSKELWLKDDYRSKVIERSSKPRHKDFKTDQSKSTKKYYNEHQEQKVIRSIKMKKRWLSGEMNGIVKKESLAEKEMFNALKLLFVDVEKKLIIINEKAYVPDCICFGNTIIEYYGDCWHANLNKYKKNDIVHSNKTAEKTQKLLEGKQS
jgi:Zn-finger nucleic acid-binding protein